MSKLNQQHIDENTIVIELPNKMVVLQIIDFDTDINVDEILKIDYGNTVGELLTFSVLNNRIANLKAEMEYQVSLAKLDVEVLEAQMYEEYKKNLIASGDKATDKAVEASVVRDVRYSTIKKSLFMKQKNLGYVESLYWAAKDKADKLNKISEKLRPEEFEKELLEDTINGVMIKCTKKSIN